MTTYTGSKKQSIIVSYPPRNGEKVGPMSTIRNTPEDVAKYVHAVAPELAAAADDVLARRPDHAKRIWFACLIVLEGKVKEHAQPIRAGYSDLMHDYNYELATVKSQDGQRDYKIMTYTSHPDSHLYCTCPDTSAPATRQTDHACKHLIAYCLSGDAK